MDCEICPPRSILVGRMRFKMHRHIDYLILTAPRLSECVSNKIQLSLSHHAQLSSRITRIQLLNIVALSHPYIVLPFWRLLPDPESLPCRINISVLALLISLSSLEAPLLLRRLFPLGLRAATIGGAGRIGRGLLMSMLPHLDV